jgi:arylsulfatase
LFGNRAIRQGNWKLTWGASEKRWELYDLNADRSETNNLSAKFPDRVTAMARDWKAWQERVEQ